ncbi:fluoride efflux transporter FluC [Microbacterium proteolyticum]|nr:CrcB family protein [Microbacterium proteolyticum]
MLRDVVLVAVGGAIGTALRAGITLALGDDVGSALVPLINVVGAFAIGILFGWRSRMSASSRAQHVQLFVGTGVLGGFTTYSALAVEAAEPGLLWWGIGSVVLGTGAAWGGLVLGRGGRRQR